MFTKTSISILNETEFQNHSAKMNEPKMFYPNKPGFESFEKK